jgi:hypothetical protein
MKVKPSLTLIGGSKVSVESIAELYIKLTGKQMTEEELAYADSKLSDSSANKPRST